MSSPLFVQSLTVALFAVACLSRATVAGAQIYPCSPSVLGCLDNVPFFYAVFDAGAPNSIQRFSCGTEISGCLAAAFFDQTARSTDAVLLSELRREILGHPIPTPASGFNIFFDATTRTFRRPNESFGSTFAEPSTTQPRGTINVGFQYLYFGYSRIVGHDSNTATVTYLHGDNPLWRQRTSPRLRRHVLNSYATIGITDNTDISVLVPFISTQLTGSVEYGWVGRAPHESFQFSGLAAGIGDIVVSAKAVFGPLNSRYGVVGSFFIPTGSEAELSGIDTPRIRGLALWSGAGEYSIQPHANFGITLPIQRPLVDGLDPNTGYDINLQAFDVDPMQLEAVFGVDVVATPRLTLTIDLLARRTLDSAQVVFAQQRPALVTGVLIDGTVRCCIDSEEVFYPLRGDATKGLAILGGKWNVASGTLLNLNLIFPVGSYAIRPTPSVNIGANIQF